MDLNYTQALNQVSRLHCGSTYVHSQTHLHFPRDFRHKLRDNFYSPVTILINLFNCDNRIRFAIKEMESVVRDWLWSSTVSTTLYPLRLYCNIP